NSKSDGLKYVKWKYSGILTGTGIKVGSYSNFWTGGNYGITIKGINVYYGDPAFKFENILVSIIFHEDVHWNQSVWVVSQGNIGKGNYSSHSYPAPPTIDKSIILIAGGAWGDWEFPAYDEEKKKKSKSGIIKAGTYYKTQLLPFRKFFKYLKDNALRP
ncbi:MAG: hypothetical protein GXP32_08835, partial [Kiritimatiellaeota bacterium]|nr:hypothetical protein [Kiritimatiellota bacterium]